jgi:PAS domain S-box-containing protein
MSVPGAAGEGWQATATEALLDHLDGGSAGDALQLLLGRIAERLGTACRLLALDETGHVRAAWHAAGTAPAAGAETWPPAQRVPLQRLGCTLGELQLREPFGDEARRALDPVLVTAAALLQALASGTSAPTEAVRAATIRAALRGSDTFVWDWDIDHDVFADIDQGLEMLGYAPGEMARTQAAWDSLIHADDRAANLAAYEQHAAGLVPVYEHVYRIRARDGHWRWFQERGRIVEWHADGRPRRMVGTQVDITDARERERAGALAAARLERIAQHVPGVLYQFELSAEYAPRFVYVSERSLPLLGLTPAELLADSVALLDRIDEGDRDAVVASIIESASRLTLWRWEFRVQLADGTRRWLLATASPQREADGRTVWHGYMQDVSDLRELERAHRDRAAAEAANRAKTEFLSRMSHELRTPLNAVLGFAQLLEIELDAATPPDAAQRRHLRLIREAGAHLLRMISDLLDLTRIEDGQLPVHIDSVPLRALAEEALAMVRPRAAAAGIALRLALPAGDLAARADPTRLRQILLNLLDNAIKFNRSAGSVELEVAPATEAGPAWVRLRVRDTGAGIAATDLPRVFEPFNRLAQARGGIGGGGIGLAVTHALVLLMHGRIDVRSVPGQGSTFDVTLPTAAA